MDKPLPLDTGQPLTYIKDVSRLCKPPGTYGFVPEGMMDCRVPEYLRSR